VVVVLLMETMLEEEFTLKCMPAGYQNEIDRVLQNQLL
jgi:hypothetical protein